MRNYKQVIEEARKIYARIAPKIAQLGIKWDKRIHNKISVELYESIIIFSRFKLELKQLNPPKNEMELFDLWFSNIQNAYQRIQRMT